MKTRIEQLKELIEQTILKDLDIDYTIESVYDFIEHLEDLIDDKEIIYYSNALKYLTNNDPSLLESLAIASEYGYEVKNLNSELLATLLYQNNLTKVLGSLVPEIRRIF